MMGGDMGQMMRMMSGMMPREGGGMDMMPGQHVEGRIGYLKAELGITDVQLPQWNAFAEFNDGRVWAKSYDGAKWTPGQLESGPVHGG
jgi:hypothetical protein